MSGTEARVWVRLRGRQLGGWRFRRQNPIGPYYADFYCPATRLIVEIDGEVHDHDVTAAYDQRRDAWLRAEGYSVLRVPARDVDRDLDEVMHTIFETLEEFRLGPSGGFAATSPLRGEDEL